MSKKIHPVIYYAFIPAILVIAIIIPVNILTKIAVEKFTRDVAVILKIKPYIGMLSNIGMVLWSSAASICFFAFIYNKQKRNTKFQVFFLFSAILTTVLLLDDLFMLHEFVLPKYLFIPENLIIGVYGLSVLLYFILFRKIFSETYYLPLVLSLIFFALSIGFDFYPRVLPWHYLFEDGLKFLGIVGWLAYFSKTSLDSIIS